jgi:hypothetical protein
MSGSGIAPWASAVVEGTMSADKDDEDDGEDSEGSNPKPSMDPSNEKLDTSLMIEMFVSSSFLSSSLIASTKVSTISASITGDDGILSITEANGGGTDEDEGTLLDVLVVKVVVETLVVGSPLLGASFRLRRFFFFPSLLPDVTASTAWCRSKE